MTVEVPDDVWVTIANYIWIYQDDIDTSFEGFGDLKPILAYIRWIGRKQP